MTTNDAGIQSAPLSFLRGGLYQQYNGSLSLGGVRGSYWEKKSYGDIIYVYYLKFDSDYLIPQAAYASSNGVKGIGHSIRCVVR